MNKEQKARLKKASIVTGIIICGIIAWLYFIKSIMSLIMPYLDKIEQIIMIGVVVGLIGFFIFFGITNGFYHVYTWIATGKSKGLLDL